MRHSRFFGPLLLVGALFSTAGLAREIIPVPGLPSAHTPPAMAAQPSAPAKPSVAAATSTPMSEELAQTKATPTPVGAAAAPNSGAALTPPNDHQAVATVRASIQNLTAFVSYEDKAANLLDRMNNARAAEGSGVLSRDLALDDVALTRARNLVANGYFDHYAPDGESAFSELGARGIYYRLAGENLARNNYAENRTVQAAFDGLMASPGHRANILEPRFTRAGIAVVLNGRMWIYVTVFMD